MASDLPPRLSDRQKFVLAELVARADRAEARGWGSTGTKARALSRAVAQEFDATTDNTPMSREELEQEHQEELVEAESDDERERIKEQHEQLLKIRSMFSGRRSRGRDEVLSRNHRSTHSRTLDRLEDRGLIDRSYHHTFERQTNGVATTEEGEAAGREVLRRVEDGRYSLSFDTLTDAATDG